MKVLTRVVWALALAACAVGSMRAQAATISGHVVDAATKRPIRGALVAVVGTTFQSTTDRTGFFELDSVPAGVIAIRGAAMGYRAREFAGLRITALQDRSLELTLDASPASTSPVTAPPTSLASVNSLLKFQLIRPIATKTTNKAIMPIDSALKGLLQWPGYELLSEALAVTEINSHFGTTTQLALTAGGDTYDLKVSTTLVAADQVRMEVTLTGWVRAGGVASAASGAAQASKAGGAIERTTLLSSTVTVGMGRTIVLGSTQPGAGKDRAAGGMAGTLILAVRPEIRTTQ